ncbi:hypothetical protein [Bacillus sp. OK048]|uniref:hypothetical protein n=1 Tax=Bacillus sp. OK048 TaxID=1882761 RepID=UPI0008825078|nr:hypothetical protein [Bacillus sp. OK048]SDN05907.1 hypothetical protein SAMN05443253_107312 [Bacillus sp. OK048]
MKYLIVYFTHTNGRTFEYYMKGKSADFLLNRLEWYCDGIVRTDKGIIKTDNLKSIFVREINPNDFPHLTKRDFAMINENKSYGKADFLDDDIKF